MKKYEKYKDSGIEWLGEIPVHWNKLKLGRSFLNIGSGTTPKSTNPEYYENGQINWLNTGDLNDSYINETSKKITQLALKNHSALKEYPIDSIVIALYGATIGKLGHLKISTTTNQACCVISESEKISQRFLFYYFFAAREFIISKSYGGGQPNISQDMIRQLYIPAPSLSEQKIIINFLDHKTTQIDSLIEKKEQLIEKLKLQRQAIINEAVTKGLNPNVPMKDSGIEWLGKIPEHWAVVKLKYLVKDNLQYGANESAEIDDPSLPRYIRITDFGDDGKLKPETFKSLPKKKADGYYLEEGDILFARSGATVGKTFQFKDYKGSACFAGYLIKARVDENKLLSDYLYLYTKSGIYENWKNSIFNQATIQNIGADKYKELPVIIPNINEQSRIITYLEDFTLKLDLTVEKLVLSIEKLKLYRQSLISEAVTGKIDVRGWSKP